MKTGNEKRKKRNVQRNVCTELEEWHPRNTLMHVFVINGSPRREVDSVSVLQTALNDQGANIPQGEKIRNLFYCASRATRSRCRCAPLSRERRLDDTRQVIANIVLQYQREPRLDS